MAKQTFTTGQVLTAAQMTSLQETAMGGGPATAKTASYVLVAADAGTTVAMNAAGATTITVNTGLFAAGDTVFIQNLGAGACTVTAGTATVATAGSLILPQNDAGILYFTATGAAIFYDYIQAGAVSPLTTKGDLYTFSTSDARLGVGANGTTLVADSAEATGLKWAAAASGGLVLINKTTLSSTTSVSLNNVFSATYDNYRIQWTGKFAASDTDVKIRMRVSGTDNSSGIYYYMINRTNSSGTVTSVGGDAQTQFILLTSPTVMSSFAIDIFRPFATECTTYNGTMMQRASDRGGYTTGFIDNAVSYDGFTLFFANNCVGTLAVYGYGI